MPSSLYLDGSHPVYIANVEGDVYVNTPLPGKGFESLPIPPPEIPVITGGMKCTKDVRQCPDGSFVSRSGPDCSFPPCPMPEPVRGGAGGLVVGKEPSVEEAKFNQSADAFTKWVNRYNVNARYAMLETTAKTFLDGAQVGLIAMKSAIQDRVFDESVKALADDVSKAKPVSLPSAPPKPYFQVTFTALNPAIFRGGLNNFYGSYGGRISSVASTYGFPDQNVSFGNTSVSVNVTAQGLPGLKAIADDALSNPALADVPVAVNIVPKNTP